MIMLKLKNSNENVVCAECGTCVFNSNHDACVSRYLKDVNARTKKPNVVPISASKPKRKANKSVATPHTKTVASDTTIQEISKITIRRWTKKIWMLRIRKDDGINKLYKLIPIIVDSGCTKHHDGNLKLLVEFLWEKFLARFKPRSSWPRSSMFKRCLIAADQASVFMEMMSVHISSGLVFHQMTSDHNRSELGIQDHSK
ncbi:hypothetical protein Tco_0316365 [Tanacetum coccineum]